MANGRETEHITLEKQVGTSLGFSVVGLESENRGELGIFVQEIQPGTITDEDGRLKESDQILVINGKPLGPSVSHTEAIAALQAVKDSVHLIIARGPIPRQPGRFSDSESQASEVDLKPAEKRWAHSEIVVLHNEGSGFGFGIVGGKATGVQIKTILPDGLADRDGRLQSGDTILKINDIDLSGMGSKEAATILQETGSTVKLEIARGELPTFNQLKTSPDEVFDVELTKNAGGIGIHIAGWVNDGSSGIAQHGIYVKAVTPGSPAANDGRIEAGDQIIAVNGLRLDGQGVGSEEAVEALQNTGDSVHLTLSRRKRKSTRLTDQQIAQLSHYWQKIVGDKFEIIVGELTKEYENAGLGIDVEGLESEGQFKHIIRSVSPSGPVGTKTGIKAGDEVLEVNGEKLIGMNHLAAVQIIRSLPEHVVLVCARRKVEEETVQKEENVTWAASPGTSMSEYVPTVVTSDNMVAASIGKTVVVSEDSSVSSEDSEEEDDLVWIELEKGNSGLGFSILDAPDRDGANSIRIRGLVPGGVADQDGRLSPGDQIIRVNEIKFDMRVYSLKDCVEVLKGLPPGIVKIGVRKVDEDADEPVVLEDNEETVIEESINFEQNRNQMAALAPVIKQPIQIEDNSHALAALAEGRPEVETAFAAGQEHGRELVLVKIERKTGETLGVALGKTEDQYGRIHIVVNDVKVDTVADEKLLDDDEIIMINEQVVGPFPETDIHKAIAYISEAGNSLEIVVSRERGTRPDRLPSDSFFTEEGERETKVFEDEPFVMAKPGLENVSENDFAFISDIIITKREDETFGFGLEFDEQPTIKTIKEDTPAARSTIREGDILLEVNHQPVHHLESREIMDLLKSNPTQVNLKVGRNDVTRTLSISSSSSSSSDSDSEKSDILETPTAVPLDGFEIKIVRNVTYGFGVCQRDGKILIKSINEDTPADNSGLEIDDQIIMINGVALDQNNVQSALEEIKKADGVVVLFLHRASGPPPVESLPPVPPLIPPIEINHDNASIYSSSTDEEVVEETVTVQETTESSLSSEDRAINEKAAGFNKAVLSAAAISVASQQQKPKPDSDLLEIKVVRDQSYGFAIHKSDGIRVQHINPNSASEQAGLLVGDQIVFIGDMQVDEMELKAIYELISSATEFIVLKVRRSEETTVEIEEDTVEEATETIVEEKTEVVQQDHYHNVVRPAYGRIIRVSKEQDEKFGFGVAEINNRLIVQSVSHDSPSSEALLSGNEIVSINGQSVNDMEITEVIEVIKTSTFLTLAVRDEIFTKILIVKFPDEPGFGFGIRKVDESIVVSVVGDDSPAAKAFLKPNDVIKSIDEREVEGYEIKDVVDMLKNAGSRLELLVERGERLPTLPPPRPIAQYENEDSSVSNGTFDQSIAEKQNDADETSVSEGDWEKSDAESSISRGTFNQSLVEEKKDGDETSVSEGQWSKSIVEAENKQLDTSVSEGQWSDSDSNRTLTPEPMPTTDVKPALSSDSVSDSEESDEEEEKKKHLAAAIIISKKEQEAHDEDYDSSTTEEDVYELKNEAEEEEKPDTTEEVVETITEVKEEQLIKFETSSSSSSEDEAAEQQAGPKEPALKDPSYEEIMAAISLDKPVQPVQEIESSSTSSDSTIEDEMVEIIETVETVESSAIVKSAPKPDSASPTPGKAIIGGAVLKELASKETVNESVEELTENSTPFVEPHKSFEGTENETDTESDSSASVHETIKVEETVTVEETVEDEVEAGKKQAALLGAIVVKEKLEEEDKNFETAPKLTEDLSDSSSSTSEDEKPAPAPPATPPKEEFQEPEKHHHDLEKSVHFRENLEDVRIMEEVPDAFGLPQCTPRFEMLSESHQRLGQKQFLRRHLQNLLHRSPKFKSRDRLLRRPWSVKRKSALIIKIAMRLSCAGAETTDNESIFSDAQESVVESIVSATTIHSHTKPDEPQILPQEDNTAHEIKRIPEVPVQIAETKDTTDDEKLNVPSSDSEPDLPQEPESIIDTREVRTIRINKGTASLGITVSPDTLNRGLVIRSVISNGAVAKHGELEAGDIIVSVNDSDVAGLETEKARQLIRHHSYHSSTVILQYLPSTDRLASEQAAAAVVEEPVATVDRVPSSAGLSDAYLTEATTDDERDALWNPPQPYTIARPSAPNGSLGLTLVDYSEISHRGFDLPRGTYVKSVDEGSPAEAAGLKFGDRIIKVNGQSTVKSSHQTVIRLIKASDQEKIHLQVQPLKPQCTGDLVLYESETETTLSSSTNSNNSQILATPEIAPGQEYSVTLHKLNGSLGVSLIGNQSGDAGIRVVKITPDGAAEKDGRIQVGDEVVTINGVPLADKSQLETINLLKEHDSAKITLIRSDGAKVPYSAPAPKLTVDEEISRLRLNVSKKDVDSVEVIKLVKDFNGLGISFEDDNNSGVRVRSLSANSPASRDGRLKNGDKILAVNDTNCQHSSYRDVTDILKSSRGTIKLIVLHPSSRRDSSSTISSRHSREVHPGTETEIEIIKGSSGLGLSIAGGAETVLGCVVIHEVYPGSAAHQDGRLAPGDRIIAVNGVDISTYTHNQASEVLRKSGSRVRLRIVRDESGQADTMKVRLNKIPGQGLGLNIENGPSGTIIFGIVPGSEAAIDGTLQQGDEIIGANGVDLSGATRDRVASELKKATGQVVIEIRRPRKSQNGASKTPRRGSHIRKVTIKRRHAQEPSAFQLLVASALL
ncbi:Oidioi.mRNA.OKI2018_I69.chr1.g1788.t1.cds [Oikopleura dioica]|uniref:Oidioi.mRNA.OKI2018_I69.chr1.g1788.t1.cds n=1 Tax=Oikopleura dioica TaxID=34765 RepID=A0ABN7SP09_OIKDI|nr:Oidioi.mRNA.OKI2018_I69.chr1.g1788.t1.cds [Oikopleura dioica]